MATATATSRSSSSTTSENTSGIRPLTSIFTIPTSGCDTAVRTEYAYTSSLYSCAPPAYSENVRNWGYYSPGICPQGYTIGCEPWNESRSKRSTESWGACVPISFKCDTTQSFRYAISVSGTSTISYPFIAIRWASADLSILETNPTSPTNTARPTASGSSTSTSRTSTSSRNPTATNDQVNGGDDTGSGSSELSGGAIAGIVIGAIAGIALIALAAFFIWRHRRKNAATTSPGQNPAAAYNAPPGGPGAPPPGGAYYGQPGQQPYPSPGPYAQGQHPQSMYMQPGMQQPGMQQLQQPQMAYYPSPGTDPSRPYSTMTSVSGTTAGAPPGSMYNTAAAGGGMEAPKYAGWQQGGPPPAELPSERLAEPAAEMPGHAVQPVQEVHGHHSPGQVQGQPVQGQQSYQAWSPPPAGTHEVPCQAPVQR